MAQDAVASRTKQECGIQNSGCDLRRRLLFVTPSSCRTTIGDRAFFVAAPRVWNTLSSSVTEPETIGTFKRRLKTHLKAYFNFSKLRTSDFVLCFDFEKCSWSNL